MTDMITRCPSCETSFRITEAQLKTAKGSVRCGSCLQIFKAADNLVLRKKPAAAAAPAAEPTAKHPKTDSETSDTQTAKPASAEPATIAVAQAPEPTPQEEHEDPEPNSENIGEAEFSKMFEFEGEDLAENSEAEISHDFPVEDFGAEDSTAEEIDQEQAPIQSARVEDSTPISRVTEASPTISEPPEDELIDQPLPEAQGEEFATSSDQIDDDDLVFDDEEDKAEPIGEPGPKNTFLFDQSAIDNDEVSGPQTSLDDDNLLISDEMEFEDDEPPKNKSAYGEDLVESFLDLDSWQPKSSSLFDRGESSKKNKDDDEDEKDPDESWAIDLLEDDDDDAYPASAKSIDLENPDTEEDAIDSLGMIGVVDDLKRSTDDYSRVNTGSFAAVEDEDFDDYEHEDHLGEHLSEHVEPSINEDEVIDFQAPYSEPDEDDYDGYDDEYDDYSDDPKNRGALLRRIQPEPVEFAFYQGGNQWGKRLLWGGAVSLGVLVLILQVAWLQFDTLSRQEPYRAWYTAFCPIFGCTVPTLDAPQLIRTSNLVVRSHPSVANALMIDTILRNTAPHKQPFPDLVLTFSNLQGDTLAARRFTPAEYLGGELAGKTNDMPSNQPIHLSLEIADPGPEAVNYSAYIPN
ncbi:hypothetical protein NBRC116493_06790 [Aurantivibrio infirmus]